MVVALNSLPPVLQLQQPNHPPAGAEATAAAME